MGTTKTPDSPRDRSLQEWICQENIKNLRAQLAETNVEKRRATLSSLLAEQEAILAQLRSRQGEE